LESAGWRLSRWLHIHPLTLLFARSVAVPHVQRGLLQYLVVDGEFLGCGDWGQGVPFEHSLDVSDCFCADFVWAVGVFLFGEFVGGCGEAVAGGGSGGWGGGDWDGEEEDCEAGCYCLGVVGMGWVDGDCVKGDRRNGVEE